jgi:hypothetical protein
MRRSLAIREKVLGADHPEVARSLNNLAGLYEHERRYDVGAADADIHLDRDASETTLKRAALAQYCIVYFATRGLVAGDVKGLGEPSLALSISEQPSELDDGPLAPSEVAQLKLNADWRPSCSSAKGRYGRMMRLCVATTSSLAD